jgi:N-acetylglucosamine kinase-like BadF-type ATPase
MPEQVIDTPRLERRRTGRIRTPYVIGIDAGNSKSDAVVATTSGRLLAWCQGPGLASPLNDLAAWRYRLISLVEQAVAQAGAAAASTAACAVYFLANVDLPAERRIARRELTRAALAQLTVVENDTHAVLHAGAARPWGVAVVAGAGINAVGVHPSGRTAGYLAFGDYTGDFGGGHSLGVQCLGAAIRDRDGRGPRTALTTLVPRHFGLRTADEVAIAVHNHTLNHEGLHVLAPVLFEAASARDSVAMAILRAFGDEVAIMANALIRRLHLVRTDVEVILGGGTLQSNNGVLLDRVTAGVKAKAPRAQIQVLDVAPVCGAVVDALRRVGAGDVAQRSIRRALIAASKDPRSSRATIRST